MRKYGVWTTIDRGPIHRELSRKYSRNPEGLCTKIFDREPSDNIQDFKWGGDWGFNILDCTRFQNICAYKGLAPRVYAVDVVEYGGHKCVAQLTDFVTGTKGKDKSIIKQIHKINEEYGGVWKNGFEDYKDVIGGKFVDFQIFSLDNEVYKRKVIDLAENKYWGFFYQSIPELNLKAHRNIYDRVQDLDLGTIDWTDRVVIDLGCSNGGFCNYVNKKGGRAIGLELEVLIEPARHLANYLGHFNIDYYLVDLKNISLKEIQDLTGIKIFDVAMFLSMDAHVGVPDWLSEISQVLIYEMNGGKIKDETIEKRKQLLSKFKIIKEAITKDRGRKAYILQNENLDI